MKKYDAYKPSGIAWIGDAPEEWEKCRFKNFITLINKPTVGGNKIGLENIESGSGKLLPTDSEFDGDGVGFIAGDIVYGKLRPYLMKVWVAEFPGNAVGDFFVFRVKDNADSSFVKYLMLSDGFTKEANGATEGAKMPRVSSDFILTLRYYLPSKEEQTAIAAYLDAKCAKIDNVVAVQQKRIELLKELKQSIITHAVTKGLDKNAKMKDSGIEWIGEVPEKWTIKRMRFLCRMSTGDKDTINKVDDGLYPFYVRSPQIERINSYTFDGEAILMAGDGVGAGKVIHYANGKFDYHQRVYNFHNFKEIQTKLAYYYLISNFRYKIEEGGAKNTVDSVRLPWLKDFPICIPPSEEQSIILDYVEKKCAIIDRQIAKVEKQIELLNEYKQSVITECVTGKRKVC